MTHTRRLAGMVALSLFSLTCAGEARQNNAAPNTVFVNATAKGPKKAYAAGLKQDQFQVWEDGKEQKISYFQAEDGPWSFGIIIGVDGFLPGRADLTTSSIRDAVATFQKTGNPKNSYFIDELPFGSNGIYDAVSRGLNRLNQDPNPRRAMLLITNGFDTTEGDPGHPLIEFAKKLTNVPLYLIFSRGASPQSPTIAEVAKGNQYWLSGGRVWEELASTTGGQMHTADALYEMEALARRIAGELRSQYLLGYQSANDTKLGTWRKLRVKVNTPKGQPSVNVEHKSRYFAPKPN